MFIMFHDFSSDFISKNSSFINLNNGTLGLCPDVVIRRQIAEIQTFEHNTSAGLGAMPIRFWALHEALAKFIGASPQDLFLRPNITLVLNEMILGLKLPESSEILTGNYEYGAIVNVLKLKAENENHTLRVCDMSYLSHEDIDEDEAARKFIAQVKPQTKLVMLSHVLTGNGIRLPIAKIGKALRERNIFFIVDGAHAPGLFDLKINQDFMDIDFYSGNLHKWVMGPKGTAFGWVHPRLQNQTSPLFASWTSVAVPPPMHQQFQPAGSFALRMLWSHSQSFSSYYALEDCFNYWNFHTKEKIFAEIWARAQYLQEGLQEIGLKPLKSLDKPMTSPLLSYAFENFQEELLVKNMFTLAGYKKLQVAKPFVPGSETIRLTAHIHNTKDELDSAVQILAKARK